MSYQVLARKWRPHDFESMVGQEHVVAALKHALDENRLHHAYLFTGTRGVGKTTLSRILAKCLNCVGEDGKGGVTSHPCGKCEACRAIDEGRFVDYIEIDAASNRSVEEMTQLLERAMYAPSNARYKVYMIDEVHMLTTHAFNAMLKTLEEPPEYGVIILMTSSLEALLPTIQSRCVLLNMRPVRDELVQKYLMEQLQVPDYRAKLCTAFARGNIGQAKLLASSEDFDRVREEAVTLLKYINEMEITELAAAVRKITEYQLDMTDYLDIISVWYRDVLMFKAMNDANHLIFREEIQYIKRVADRSSYEGLEKILDALEKAKARLRANVSFELTMELLFLTIQENT